MALSVRWWIASVGAWYRRSRLAAAPGQPPLLAQLTSVDPAVAGPGVALAVFIDPLSFGGDVQPALRLFGLTPSEARVAAKVGEGSTPRLAAEALGLTENTVRTTLKLAYGKLGINRQPELTRLVARLQAGTVPDR